MDDWSWWMDKLAGKPVEANPDSPRWGFYRQSYKAVYGGRKTFTPVAYYPDADTGEMRCRIGDEDISGDSIRATRMWNHVHNNPVTFEAFNDVAEKGALWPDEHELVPMGHNRPPDIDWEKIEYIQPDDTELLEQLHDQINNLAREAERRIEGPPIADQDEADRIANLADALQQLNKIADGTRAHEKKPHDEAAKLIQKKWAPWLLKTETYRNLKYKLLTPWLKRLDDERKKEAEAAAAAGAPIEMKRPRAGTRGRAMSLKSLKRAEIYDYDKCLAYFAESPDVKATVQDLANRAVRAGITVPGAKVLEESQAV
jgi:hypothetical protein